MQEVDLLTALMAEGMATPRPAPTRALPAPAAPPLVQRMPEPSGPTPTPTRTASGSTVPQPGSVEAAMLELLKLPPDTAVYGLKSPASNGDSAPSGPTIQRKPLDQALADGDTTSEAPSLQRVITLDEMSASLAGDEAGSDQGGPDIEDLARKVYGILRERLRVEQERSGR